MVYRLFLDTEFNSFEGAFISIALVGEDGREFYAVGDIPAEPHPWVAEHVLPLLDAEPIGYEGVRTKLHEFLATLPPALHVYADWPTDHAHLMNLLCCATPGQMVSKTVVAILAQPPRNPEPAIPHNALSDARALRAAWSDAL